MSRSGTYFIVALRSFWLQCLALAHAGSVLTHPSAYFTVSAKFTVLCLDGKSRSRTRVRIDRLVAAGTVEKLGPRTYREVLPAYAPRVTVVQFEEYARRINHDTSLDGGALLSWVGVHYLPYNFPLPLTRREKNVLRSRLRA